MSPAVRSGRAPRSPHPGFSLAGRPGSWPLIGWAGPGMRSGAWHCLVSGQGRLKDVSQLTAGHRRSLTRPRAAHTGESQGSSRRYLENDFLQASKYFSILEIFTKLALTAWLHACRSVCSISEQSILSTHCSDGLQCTDLQHSVADPPIARPVSWHLVSTSIQHLLMQCLLCLLGIVSLLARGGVCKLTELQTAIGGIWRFIRLQGAAW